MGLESEEESGGGGGGKGAFRTYYSSPINRSAFGPHRRSNESENCLMQVIKSERYINCLLTKNSTNHLMDAVCRAEQNVSSATTLSFGERTGQKVRGFSQSQCFELQQRMIN